MMLHAARRIDAIADPLDTALADLAAYGPEMRNGFTSHAPMVAEALDALGRGDAIASWIEACRAQLLPWPARTGVEPQLGVEAHVSDWRALFAAEIEALGWRKLLARWVPRLSAGASGGALHGLIRTGHAARALGRADTEARRDELAAALASWAMVYAELPIAGALGAVPMSADAALSRLPFLPAERRRNGGSIVGGLAALVRHIPLARAYHWLAIDDPKASVGELADLFARVFLANVDSPLHAIVFTHAVTGTAAASNLLPFISEEDGRALMRHVWHAGCALYAAYGTTRPIVGGDKAIFGDELADRAIANGDDHVVKLTEAVLALRLEPALASAVSVRAMEFLR